MVFREITPETIDGNVFKMIGQDWMLITAGTLEKFNTMTASWGGMGVLWNRNVAFCVIRPQRYTYEFVENGEYFTLGFFPEEYRPQLVICGAVSGREVDKREATSFKALPSPEGAVYFEQSDLVIVCKKLYAQDIDPQKFVLPELDSHYPDHDYHRMYVGEIVRVLKTN